MTLWESLLSVARQTFRAPKEAAVSLMALNVPQSVLGPAFVVVMILSVIVTEPMLAMLPEEVFGAPVSPLMRAALSVVFNLALVWMIFKTANLMGGEGSFAATLLVFIFLEVLLALGIALLLVLLFVLPALSGIVGLGFFGFWIYLIGVFFSEAHKLDSALKAFVIVVVAWTLTYVAMIFVMRVLLGVGGGVPNV